MVRKVQKEKSLIVLQFLLVFNLFAIPMYLIMYTNFQIESFKSLNAFLSSKILNLLGLNSVVYSNVISIDSYKFHISWDSTAWKSLYALFCLVIATPIAMKKKIWIIVLGLPIIFLANLLRIASTIYISLTSNMLSFSFLHLLLWREGMILLVISIWGIWLWKEKNNISKKQIIFRWAFGEKR